MLTLLVLGCTAPVKVHPISELGNKCPKPTHVVNPLYPRSAINAGVTHGNVVVHVDLYSDGPPQNIRVIKSKPQGAFDAVVIAALQRWRFEVSKVYLNCIVDIDFKLVD